MTRKGLFHPLTVLVLAVLVGIAGPAAAKPRFSAIAIDASTGKILFARNADGQRYPASLTKVMTLYIVFQELTAGRLTLKSTFVVSKHAASMQPSKLGLKPGARIKVEDAIKALVTKSANDIAVTVAEGIGKTESAFAQRMTRTARFLGMTRTRFRNASGLPNRQQVTTARDMATLGLRIQRDFPKLYKYFATARFQYKGRSYHSHNRLLGRYKGTDGIKTGYTRASGFNLISSVRRGNRHTIGVVMGGKSGRSRDAYMVSMLNRVFKRIPNRRNAAIAKFAGTPPGLKATPKKLLAKKTPLPKPKPDADSEVLEFVPLPDQDSDQADLVIVRQPKSDREPTGRTVLTKPQVLDPAPASSADPASTQSIEADGWTIQIGAYSNEAEAKRRLAKTILLGLRSLSGKEPYTAAVVKDDKLLYRARFAGFDKTEARNTCAELKRKSISCFMLAPDG